MATDMYAYNSYRNVTVFQTFSAYIISLHNSFNKIESKLFSEGRESGGILIGSNW